MMKNEDYKYKVGGKLQGFFPYLILVLVFGGFSIALYVTHSNKLFIIGGFYFTAFIFSQIRSTKNIIYTLTL